MKKEFLLNEFQKKTILSKLSDLSALGVFESSAYGDDTRYSCFFEFRDHIFAVDCNYWQGTLAKSLPDIEKLSLDIREVIENKIKNLELDIFVYIENKDLTLTSLCAKVGHYVLQEAWIYSRFEYFDKLNSDIFKLDAALIANSHLLSNKSIFEAYKEVMKKYELNKENIVKFLEEKKGLK